MPERPASERAPDARPRGGRAVTERDEDLEARAARHAALGDAGRLAIVEELLLSDRAPVELRRLLGMESNLLAHHLDVLEGVGLIERSRSDGDGRRRYVHLVAHSLDQLTLAPSLSGSALFVCSANSARSQIAAALWRERTGMPAASAGTHPAVAVDPGAVAAAARAGVDIADASPRSLDELGRPDDEATVVVTVCDRAHEEIDPGDSWLHWSVTDPVPVGSAGAFDAAVAELDTRIRTVTGS